MVIRIIRFYACCYKPQRKEPALFRTGFDQLVEKLQIKHTIEHFIFKYLAEPCAWFCPLDVESPKNSQNRTVMSMKPMQESRNVFFCPFYIGCLWEKSLHNITNSLFIKIDQNELLPYCALSDPRQWCHVMQLQ